LAADPRPVAAQCVADIDRRSRRVGPAWTADRAQRGLLDILAGRPDQTDRWPRHTQTNGDLRAKRPELELIGQRIEHVAALFVRAVIADRMAEQAGADADGYALRSCGLCWGLPTHRIFIQHCHVVSVYVGTVPLDCRLIYTRRVFTRDHAPRIQPARNAL